MQRLILGFHQTCEHEEDEQNRAMIKAGMPRFK
jgi:hypothetical protein